MSSLPRRLRGGRRDQLLLHQAHALDHYEDLLRLRSPLYVADQLPTCRGFPNPLRRDTITCPTCGRPTPLDQLSEDHAPQKREQSSLGPATTIVLTCGKCNNENAFERTASRIGRLEELEIDDLACPVHGYRRIDHGPKGLHVVAEETALVLADVKSAFLLAFASLGYGWALAKELGGIRSALAVGDLPDHEYAWQGVIKVDTVPPGNSILEVIDPTPCIIVRASNHGSVVLPAPGHSLVPRPDQLGSVRVRTFPWPETNGPGQLVEKAYEAGHLFHFDFCKDDHW